MVPGIIRPVTLLTRHFYFIFRQAPAVDPDEDDDPAEAVAGPSRAAPAGEPAPSDAMQTDEDGWTVARKRR